MPQHLIISSDHSPLTVATATSRAAGLRLKRLWQALQNRRAVNDLTDFDARMLKDIGLIHSDITAALDQSWGKDPSEHLANVAAGRWPARHRNRN